MSLHLFFTQEFKDKYKINFLFLFFKFVIIKINFLVWVIIAFKNNLFYEKYWNSDFAFSVFI